MLQVLWGTFAVGGAYQVLTLPVPSLAGLAVFSWVGLPGPTEWRWVLTPSPGYLGPGPGHLQTDTGMREFALGCIDIS